MQINFQFRAEFGDVNVTLHKQALLNCGVCGTEVTVEIGDCEIETAQTALAGTTVTASFEHNGYIEQWIREGSKLSTNKRQPQRLPHNLPVFSLCFDGTI